MSCYISLILTGKSEANYVYEMTTDWVDPSSREKAIRELLARHVSQIDQNAKAFLVENLSIPQRFLDEAQATYGEEDEEQSESRDL